MRQLGSMIVPEIRSLLRERDDVLSWLRRYRAHSKSMLWNHELTYLIESKPAAARPTRQIKTAFAQAGEERKLRMQLEAEHVETEAQRHREENKFFRDLQRRCNHELCTLDAHNLSRSVSISLALSAAAPCRAGEDDIGLPLYIKLCMEWLGCPHACRLAVVSPAFITEIGHFRSHGLRCPAIADAMCVPSQ